MVPKRQTQTMRSTVPAAIGGKGTIVTAFFGYDLDAVDRFIDRMAKQPLAQRVQAREKMLLATLKVKGAAPS